MVFYCFKERILIMLIREWRMISHVVQSCFAHWWMVRNHLGKRQKLLFAGKKKKIQGLHIRGWKCFFYHEGQSFSLRLGLLTAIFARIHNFFFFNKIKILSEIDSQKWSKLGRASGFEKWLLFIDCLPIIFVYPFLFFFVFVLFFGVVFSYPLLA